MDEWFDDRLLALGLNKAKLAERLGVSKQAVGQWKELPEKAEALLNDLERRSVGVIPLGAAVRTEDGTVGRVVITERIDRLFGSRGVGWVYHVSEVKQQEDETWVCIGPARRWPEASLKPLGRELVWGERKIPKELEVKEAK